MEVLREKGGMGRTHTTLLDGILNLPKREKNHMASCITTSSRFYDSVVIKRLRIKKGPEKRQIKQKHEEGKEDFARFHTVLFSSSLIQKAKRHAKRMLLVAYITKSG